MANRIDVGSRRSDADIGMRWARRLPGIVLAISLGAMLPTLAAGEELKASGTVVDADTKMPIAGAYVLAGYHKVVYGTFAIGSWCVKTRGTYAGPDGRFVFPLGRRDEEALHMINAIKSDYGAGRLGRADGRRGFEGSADDWKDTVISLRKQDPANPDFLYGSGDEYCTRAPTKEAAAAGAQFMKIEMMERQKFGWPAEKVKGFQQMIDELNSLPGEREAK